MGENEIKKKKYIFLDNTAFRKPNWIKQTERGKTMKYIRTCTGVYCVEDYFNEDSVCVFGEGCVKVLQTADTIEELCDEFVVIQKDFRDLLNADTHCLQTLKRYYEINKIKVLDIYGAIWTDKGLIYVAKMNEKGELELLRD